MTENKVSETFNNLQHIEDPFDKAKVLSILNSRIGAGLELKETDAGSVDAKDVDEIWGRAVNYFEGLIKIDPDRALQTAVDLALLPLSTDEKQKTVDKWMITNALSALGLKGIDEKLPVYFEIGTNGEQIADKLANYIKEDLTSIKSEHDLHEPEGFSTVQSIYIGLGFEGAQGKKARELYELSKLRKNDKDIINVAGFIKSFPGCEYLGERL